jgi:hypothetical protein
MCKRIFSWMMAIILLTGSAVMAQTVLTAIDLGASGDDTGLDKVVGAGGWGWSASSTVDGRSVRTLESSAIDSENVHITVPANGGTVRFTYKDDPALSPGTMNLLVFLHEWDGDSWRDKVLGLLPLDGAGWRTVGLPLPKDVFTEWSALGATAKDTMDVDANSANGYQTRLFFTYADASGVWNAPGAVVFDAIDVIAEKDWVLDAGGHADASGTPDVNPRRFEPLSFNGWDINDAKWSAVTTVGGETCRNYAVVSGGTSANMIITLDPDISVMSVRVYDADPTLAPGFSLWANLWDGGAWQDVYLGNVALDGTGGWETHQVPIPASLYDACTDFWPGTTFTDYTANENPVGKQINVGVWAYDLQNNGTPDEGQFLGMTLPISSFGVGTGIVTGAGAIADKIDIGSYLDLTGINKLVGTWGSRAVVDGRAIRTLNASIQSENLYINVPATGGTVNFTYKDDPALSPGTNNLLVFIQEFDGDNWRDKVLGLLPLDGIGWRTVGLPLPADIYTAWAALGTPTPQNWFDGDANPANGYQMRLFFTYADGSSVWNTPGTVALDKIEVVVEKNWLFDAGSHADANGTPDTVNRRRFEPLSFNGADINDSKWSAVTTIAGQTCRQYQVTTGGVSAHFIITVDAYTGGLELTVYDNDPALAPGFSLWANLQDGGTWQDVFIGNVPLDGTGGWERVELPMPAAVYASGHDFWPGTTFTDAAANEDPVGHQVNIGLWAYDMQNNGTSDEGQLLNKVIPISQFGVSNQFVPVELSSFILE